MKIHLLESDRPLKCRMDVGRGLVIEIPGEVYERASEADGLPYCFRIESLPTY